MFSYHATATTFFIQYHDLFIEDICEGFRVLPDYHLILYFVFRHSMSRFNRLVIPAFWLASGDLLFLHFGSLKPYAIHILWLASIACYSRLLALCRLFRLFHTIQISPINIPDFSLVCGCWYPIGYLLTSYLFKMWKLSKIVTHLILCRCVPHLTTVEFSRCILI